MIKPSPCRFCGHPVAFRARQCPECGGRWPYPPSNTELIVGLLVLGLFIGGVYSLWPSVDNHPSSATSGPSYTIIDSTFTERPGKTMVLLQLCANRELTKDEVESILQHAYKRTLTWKQFRYHDKPTVINVRLYSTPEHYRGTASSWIAEIGRNPDRPNPKMTIKESALAAHNRRFTEKPQIVNGRTEAERRQIWNELMLVLHAGTHSEATARDRYLESIGWQGDKIDNERLDAILDEAQKVIDEGTAQVLNKYGLAEDERQALLEEAREKQWPMPPSPYE